jgi:hypothetical protein
MTETGKWIYMSALGQKNEGSVEAKQIPIKVGDGTIYRTVTLMNTFSNWN